MSTKTENLAFVMYRQIEAMRKVRKQPVALADLEEKLEAYLDGLRTDHAALVESLQHNVRLYQDAYENQKALTRNACVFDRERWDEIHHLRNLVKELEYNGELDCEKLKEATAKLAQQAKAIMALHRVVEDQQQAQSSLQARLGNEVKAYESHIGIMRKEIMQAEAIGDERWELIEEKQKLIVSQRKAIESLTFELADAQKQAQKRSFWPFWKRKAAQAKKLPK